MCLHTCMRIYVYMYACSSQSLFHYINSSHLPTPYKKKTYIQSKKYFASSYKHPIFEFTYSHAMNNTAM